jgi:WD40 repeat protein
VDTPRGESRPAQLIIFAVRDYPDNVGADDFAAGIDDQIAAVRQLWTADDLGDRALQAGSPHLLTTRDDVEDAIRERSLRDLRRTDAAVIYIAGHGATGPNRDRHYLLLPDTNRRRLIATAYPTADLIAAVLDSQAEHLFVLVSSCYAGTLHLELATRRAHLDSRRRGLTTIGVIACGDLDQRPRVGEMAELLRLVNRQLRETSQYINPLLSVDEFYRELVRASHQLDDAGRDLDMLRLLNLLPNSADQPTRCLPNPGYRPEPVLVSPAREQVADNASDVDYWLARASGRADDGDPGWYFAGRQQLARAMVEFGAGEDDLLVVTGVAGSGKSALLARFVTLSDPAFRRHQPYRDAVSAAPAGTAPDEGVVDAAVATRNRDVRDVAARLLAAFGIAPRAVTTGHAATTIWRQQLEAHLRTLDRRVTVVIDGVDEARSPRRLILELLGPLLKLPDRPIRLIVGIRAVATSLGQNMYRAAFSERQIDPLTYLLGAADGARTRIVRTDGPDVAADIDQYVQAMLLQPGSPYVDEPERRRQLGAVIAGKVSPSFLDARIAASRLRDQDTAQDPTDPSWLSTLQQGTVGLLARDVVDVATEDHPAEHLLAVLQAAAHAEGPGIPWDDIWPTTAQAIHNGPFVDPDATIRRVLQSRLTGFLVQGSDDGRVVHALAHARLAEILRAHPGQILGSLPVLERDATDYRVAARSRIASALATLTNTTIADGVPPHPYLRRHLIHHAVEAGMLEDEHVCPEFLPWELSGNVRGLLGLPVAAGQGRTSLAAWAAIEPYLGTADLRSRRMSHHFAQLAAAPRPAPIAPVRQPELTRRTVHAVPLVARWRPGNNVLTRTTAAALAAIVLDGRSLLAVAGQDGTIQLWDPASAVPVFDPIVYPRGGIRATAAVQLADRPLLAVAGDDGTVRLWDPTTATETGLPIDGHPGQIRTMTGVSGSDGRSLLAVSGDDGTVRFWDPATATEVGPAISFHPGRIGTMTGITRADGRPVLVTADSNGTVQLWEPGTGRQIDDPTVRGTGPVLAMTSLVIAGRATLAAARNSSVVLWDSVDARQARSAVIHQGPVLAMATVAVGARPLLATAGKDGTVRLWDPATRRNPVPHLSGPMLAVASVSDGQRIVLATIGSDGALQQWNPETGEAIKKAVRCQTGPEPVMIDIAVNGRRLLATAGGRHPVRLWDLNEARIYADARPSPVGHTRALAAVTVDERTFVVTGGDDGRIQLWDVVDEGSPTLRSRNPVRGGTNLPTGPAWTGHASPIRAMTTLTIDKQQLLATGGQDGTITLWDPTTATPHRTPMPAHTGTIRAITTITIDKQQLLATGGQDGTITLWDPTTATPHRTPMPAHTGTIRAITTITIDKQQLLATGGQDGTVRVWDAKAADELMRLVVGAPVHGLTVTADPSPATGGHTRLAFCGAAGFGIIEVRGS